MKSDDRAALNMVLTAAKQSAVVLGEQLTLMLDAFDFFVERYPVESYRDRMAVQDVQVSISALRGLLKQLEQRLGIWELGEKPVVSAMGFELHVLNEFTLHMFSLATFLADRDIDQDKIEYDAISTAFMILRRVNRNMGSSTAPA